MASSITDICNLALTNTGELTTVLDAERDNSPGARAFRRYYETARDATLAGADWGFARRWALAGAASSGVTVPAGWAYAYAYPPDCEAFRGLYATPRSASPLPAAVVNLPNAAGQDVRLILADAPAPWLVYTRRVDDPSLFSAPFVDALSWRLVRSLSMALGRSRELRQDAEAEYQRLILEAQAQALREQPRPGLPDSEMILARGGGCEPGPPGDDPARWAGWGGASVPRA